MIFVPHKETGVIPQVLTQILDSCVNGVTLSDPDVEDMPLVYANRAFELMTGYAQYEIIGRNCRFLQGPDRDQPELEKLRRALANRRSVVVDLKNYKKSGELFYNRLSITPLTDSQGRLIYFLGVQYDVTNEVLAQAKIQQLTRQLNARSGDSNSR